jgi:hypothetical protein
MRMNAPAAPATPASHGATRSRLASGTDAPARTVPTIAARSAQAGSPPSVARIVGAPVRARPPAARAIAPAAIAGATSGTTPRFTMGETIESRPNSSATIGSVASCAARDTPRDSASHARRRPGAGPLSRLLRGVPQAMRPAVARAESRKPTSSTSRGSTSRRIVTAHPIAAAARLGRPSSRAIRTTPAIAAARTTEGDAPTKMT